MKILINFFKGIAISISTLIPGVSGGTMAIILGVYDDIIHAIGSFFENWKKHSILLLEIGLGGLLGLVLFSRIVESALETYPIQMGFFFIGVVGGGIPILYKRATSGEKQKTDFIFLAIGIIIALIMSIEPGATTTMATSGGLKSSIFLFIAGFIIAIALILPGISGSYMLLILGLYDVTLNAINNINVPYLIPLGVGVLLGTLATTKAIEKLLNKYPGKTYMLILGFVVGSVPPIYPGLPQGLTAISSVLILCFGFGIIFYMGKKNL